MHATLYDIAKKLLTPGKGILAADESDSTCAKRFDAHGIPKTPETRRKWRELLFGTPGIEKGLSGVILFDETIRQKTNDGILFADYLSKRGIIPGIKVDKGTVSLASSSGEKVTEGLQGLPERLAEYKRMGAAFAKWRAVIAIGEGLPTEDCIVENSKRLALYAKDCQDAGLVPILEPEVLLDGTHDLKRSKEVLTQTLNVVCKEVKNLSLDLSGLILKSSMALPGKDSGITVSPEEVAEATLDAFLSSVPPAVQGIVFLSGGQTSKEATERLNVIVKNAKKKQVPWRLTFSYSRALQAPVMEAWRGEERNVAKAQEIFRGRVEETALASEGKL